MLSAILTIIAYLLALHFGALAWVMPLKNTENGEIPKKVNLRVVAFWGMVAVIAHASNILGHFWIDKQYFTLANVASMIAVSMSLFATIALPKWKTIWFPVSIIYVLSIVCVVISSFVEGSVIRQLTTDLGLMLHLALAVLSYALFFIALLYAVQLKWLDRKLKNKQMLFSPMLPPLMSVERHFFNVTLVAQGLLTLVLVSGMIYLHNFFAPEQVHKAVFSFVAWIVYSLLLLGHWKLGWRGNRVLIYSISGMMLLTFAYFGSRLA